MAEARKRRKKPRGWFSRKRHCPPGHHWDKRRKQCVKTGGVKSPKPTTTTTTTTTPPPYEPVEGTVSSVVATPGNEGTEAAQPGGDMTGTSQLTDAVFGQGSGYAPQLRYDYQAMQQEVQAQQMQPAQEGDAGYTGVPG